MDIRTPPWPRSRRALLIAAALATMLALLAPGGAVHVAAIHAGA